MWSKVTFDDKFLSIIGLIPGAKVVVVVFSRSSD